jgi:hypothetical protein
MVYLSGTRNYGESSWGQGRLGFESTAREDESCLLLVSPSEQLEALNASSVGG